MPGPIATPGAFQPLLVEVDTHNSQTPIITNGPPGSAALVVNVGGTQILDNNGVLVTLPGPDAAILTSGPGSQFPGVFVLPAGAALAFPADIGNIYARAASSATTLSTAVGIRGG